MLTALALLAALIQPAPAPIAVPAGQPAIDPPAYSWAFAPLSIPDEPTPMFTAEWIEFVDGERVESLMASVTPFDSVDGADPFEGGE